MFKLLSITLFLISIILGYFANRARKKRMSRALGREISDLETNSISSWMALAEYEEKSRQPNQEKK